MEKYITIYPNEKVRAKAKYNYRYIQFTVKHIY